MKRSSIMHFKQNINVDKAGFKIWGYDTKGKFVCRLEINAAGLALYTGEKGGRRIANVNWERLVEKLEN